MGIKLSSIKNNVRSVEVDYFGDKFTVRYKPSELTPEVESQIQEAGKALEGDDEQEQQGQNQVLIGILCKLVVAWEVLDEDDEPLPITPDVLTKLPSAFLSHILFACRLDMIPKAKNGRR